MPIQQIATVNATRVSAFFSLGAAIRQNPSESINHANNQAAKTPRIQNAQQVESLVGGDIFDVRIT